MINKLPTELTPQDVGGAKVSQHSRGRLVDIVLNFSDRPYLSVMACPPPPPPPSHQFDVIFGEPFFSVSLLPWHNLMFWYAATNCRVLLNAEGKVAPCAAELKAVAGSSPGLLANLVLLQCILQKKCTFVAWQGLHVYVCVCTVHVCMWNVCAFLYVWCVCVHVCACCVCLGAMCSV